MIRRGLLSIVILLAPVGGVLADAASTLGPSTTSDGGSSTGASGILQPATGDNSGAAGSSASQPAQQLQQTGSSDQVKLLVQGEADGAPVQPADNPGPTWLWTVLLVLAIAAAA